MLRASWLVAVALVAIAGCDFPRDADGTLDRVQGGEIRIGVSENPPWVRVDGGRIEGIEPELLRQWAKQLDARVRWVRGTEADLIAALKISAVDVVAAGLTDDSPWKSRVGFSRPYLTTTLRIGVPEGQPAPAEWQGREVAVDPARVRLVGLVRRQGATVLSADAASDGRRPTALYDFEIAARGMVPAGPRLATARHVVAAVPGENAFMLALDRFLQERGEREIRELAAELSR